MGYALRRRMLPAAAAAPQQHAHAAAPAAAPRQQQQQQQQQPGPRSQRPSGSALGALAALAALGAAAGPAAAAAAAAPAPDPLFALAALSDLDAATAHSLEAVLRPLFAIGTILYIIRIPMTWWVGGGGEGLAQGTTGMGWAGGGGEGLAQGATGMWWAQAPAGRRAVRPRCTTYMRCCSRGLPLAQCIARRVSSSLVDTGKVRRWQGAGQRPEWNRRHFAAPSPAAAMPGRPRPPQWGVATGLCGLAPGSGADSGSAGGEGPLAHSAD
jgi:hypothetical protein